MHKRKHKQHKNYRNSVHIIAGDFNQACLKMLVCFHTSNSMLTVLHGGEIYWIVCIQTLNIHTKPSLSQSATFPWQ